MTQVCAQTERNELDRELTDERDDDLTIPDFAPAQFTPPVTYIKFDSRGDSPPQRAIAPGCDRPPALAAGRTFFLRELKGALKFAGLCLVYAFSIGTWLFLAAVLGQGITR